MFFGLNSKRDTDGATLDESYHIREILPKFDVEDCNPAVTPIVQTLVNIIQVDWRTSGEPVVDEGSI